MKIKNIRLFLVVVTLIAGVYLFVDHGEHIAPYLPLTFLLGCLMRHLFMHGSPHEHGHNEKEKHE